MSHDTSPTDSTHRETFEKAVNITHHLFSEKCHVSLRVFGPVSALCHHKKIKKKKEEKREEAEFPCAPAMALPQSTGKSVIVAFNKTH